jgi:glycosyltransferase involved in cell wall biosynthesis
VPEAAINSLSVIIPTYNRKELLAKAIAGYLAQTSPELINELLIVDDGSTDDTDSMVRDFSRRSSFPIRYLRQPNQGPAAARNLGIREARSAVVLFTDSDIIPARNLVQQHIEWHRKNSQLPAAVLGYVTWPPEILATPFMRWYGETRLFHFQRLRNKMEVGFNYFYTCNLSLKTEFLRTRGWFDEEFKTAAFEDIELGYRLSKSGLQLLYNPAAIGYHYQFFSFEDACRKALANDAATQLFYRKEAAQQVLQEIRNRKSRAGYGLARRLAALVARLLSPIRPLLDSSIPLPGMLYTLFIWDSTRLDRQKDAASSGPRESRVITSGR